LPIVRQRVERELNCVLSNSFGFGGTNASLAFTKLAA
jgi:3-oxoacyl-[acyl-carrier-protein] synthase-1